MSVVDSDEPGVSAPATVVDFLIGLTGDEGAVRRRLTEGEIVLEDGTRVETGTPYRGGATVYLYRDLPPEVPVPWPVPVLLHDEDTGLLVVDKPPFLATMPRGGHVAQTVLVRLRRELELPELAPMHRLDRLTSGVLLLTTRASARSAYQRLVQGGGLTKTYLALAGLRDHLTWPMTIRNRLVKERGTLQGAAVPGPVNAVTEVELVRRLTGPDGGAVGLYRLTPSTGQTHQLRIHLAGLGIPILGDPLYPQVRPVAPDDFSTPLQLLAASVAFDDPVSGERRVLTSRQHLPVPSAPPGLAEG